MLRALSVAIWLLAASGSAAGAAAGFSAGVSLEGLGADEPISERKNSYSQTAGTSTGIWWQDAHGPGLRLTYAGEFENAPDGVPAIGLLFTGAFRAKGGFNRFLSVRRPDGTRVAGHWQVSASPRLLYFNVPEPGKYIVTVRAGLTAGDSEALLTTLSGPVMIGPAEQNAR